MSQKIKHIGKIIGIENNHLEVLILSVSACASCMNKKNCSLSEVQDKIIQVSKTDNLISSYLIGDEVWVWIEQKKAILAVILTYLLPTALLLFSLFVFTRFFSETSTAIFSLIVLSTYFLSLMLLKKHFNKSFQISIQTPNSQKTYKK